MAAAKQADDAVGGSHGSALSAASAGALLSRSGSSCSASDPPSCNSTGSVTLGGARAALGALSTRERAGPARCAHQRQICPLRKWKRTLSEKCTQLIMSNYTENALTSTT